MTVLLMSLKVLVVAEKERTRRGKGDAGTSARSAATEAVTVAHLHRE